MANPPPQAIPWPVPPGGGNNANNSTLLKWIFWIAVLTCVIWSAIMVGQAMSFDKPKCPGFWCTLYLKCPDRWCMLRAPGVELQLAKDPAKFQEIIAQGDPDHNIAVITRNTRMDFLFIFLYWSTFMLFALCERHRLSPFVWLAITVAAIFDIFENRRILGGMSALTAGNPVTLLPYPFSVAKWIFFAAALFFVAVLLRKAARQIWIPVFLAIAAILVLIGTFARSSQFITLAILSLFLALLITLKKYAPPLTDLLVFIEHAYLLRFQIIAAVILAAALPIGYRLVPSVFRGLFDAGGGWSLMFITWAAFQLAWTVMITSRLVLRYGPARFPLVPSIALRQVRAGVLVRFGLLAVPSLVCLWRGSLDLKARQKIFPVVIGLLLSIGMLYLTAALHFYVEDPNGGTAEEIFPSFGFLKTLRVQTLGRSRFWTRIDNWLNSLPATVSAGLLRGARLRSGHQMAAIFVFVLVVIYLLLGIFFSPFFMKAEHQPAALFFLLFVIIILAWLFAGAAFMLDRFRLPVLTTVFALSLATGLINTDHEFSLATPQMPRTTLSPKDVLDHWAQGRGKGRKKTIAIVATAGGGIRAAAWTAQVLTGLQQGCGAQDFSSALVLISSVSGGSVGSMFFLRRYDLKHGSLPAASLDDIRKDAKRSSLSSVGWGMLYPDLARTLPGVGIVVPQTFDRGWALENSWVSGWDPAPKLDEWRAAVAQGKLPAVIFNATAVESGQRFLAATTDTTGPGALRFADEFPKWDIPVATAARLSATFTYVSPVARANDGSPKARVHVADGGYYDNSGVVSALEWLTQAGAALNDYKVLFILIDADPRSAVEGQQWSWQRQIIAPIETLANVRTSSQLFRGKFELDLARQLPGLHLEEPVYFLYRSDSDNPLSWHLNKNEIHEIETRWSGADLCDSKQRVYESLGCTKPRPNQ